MKAKNARSRPLVLVALGAPRAGALSALESKYQHARIAVDEADAITPESLAANHVLRNFVRKVKDAGGRLHLVGLVSNGGAHSSLVHLEGLIDVAKSARVRVVVHALLDGIDAAPRTAAGFISELEGKLEGGVGRIGTVSGRALGMDCEGRWDRIEKVYRAITADGVDRIDSALRGIAEACLFGNIESFVKPFIVFDYPGVSLVDGALHFNFGADGARELSQALAGAGFQRFTRKGGRGPFEGRFACLTPYDSSLALPTLFPRAPDPASLPLELLDDAGYKRFLCAAGGAAAIAKASSDAIRSGQYDFVLADFANPDDTHRSGGPEALDGALAHVLEAAHTAGAAVLVLGGRDATNTAPLVYVHAADRETKIREGGRCCDLAPTLLELLQLPLPEDVEGHSLLVH